MRILHVLHSLDPRSGGPSEALREIARHQLEQGHQVTLVTTDAQSMEPWMPRKEFIEKLRQDPRLSGVNLLICHALGRRRPLSRYSWSPEARRVLRQLFRDPVNRPDIVHIHGIFSHLTGRAACLARRYRIPYVMRPAGSLNQGCVNRGLSFFKRAFIWCTVRQDLRKCAWVHATSKREADEIGNWLRTSRIEIIPHGIALPERDLERDREAFYTAFPHLRDQPFVLYMSRIAPKKRLDLLVEALADARAKGLGWSLVIAGTDDGYQAVVQERVDALELHDCVHWVGFLQGAQKSGALAAATCTALTSEDENFGVIIVEAMAHGCPVLLSEGVDNHVHVDAAEAGVTVRCERQSIAEGLLRLAAEDRDLLSRNGKRYVSERMSWESACSRMERAYKLSAASPEKRRQRDFPWSREQASAVESPVSPRS